MGALDKNKNLKGRALIGTRATNSLGFTILSQNVQQMAGIESQPLGSQISLHSTILTRDVKFSLWSFSVSRETNELILR